jgi:hypothetical protein
MTHPRRSYGRGVGLEDASDHRAVRQHVIIVVVPFATGGRCAFQGEVILFHWHANQTVSPPRSRGPL